MSAEPPIGSFGMICAAVEPTIGIRGADQKTPTGIGRLSCSGFAESDGNTHLPVSQR